MWVLYAFGSALFAGITSILAKCGIKKTDSHVATALRTIVVLIFSWLMVFIVHSQNQISTISTNTWIFLILSGFATGSSWLCYFKALQLGDVNKVVPIDKSSIILTIVLAFIFLKEDMTLLKWMCVILIGAGTYLMIDQKESSTTTHHKSWLIYALISAVFASLTSLLGKVGMQNIDSNLGTAIRTVVVLIMSWVVVFVVGKQHTIKEIDRHELLFICLSGIIDDKISDIREKVEDTLLSLKYIKDELKEETFFEDDELIRKDLLEKYIELGDSHYQYSTWKAILKGTVTKEIYSLIEDALQDYLSSIERKLENIKDSVFCVDLNCFSEGDIVRIKDFDGNEFAVNVSGWFCPERGSSNEIYVNWLKNGVNSVYGGIYISYGDYEMTEDGIPIPCVEDELIVRFSEVNNKLEEVIDSIAEILNKIENKYIELEI